MMYHSGVVRVNICECINYLIHDREIGGLGINLPIIYFLLRLIVLLRFSRLRCYHFPP